MNLPPVRTLPPFSTSAQAWLPAHRRAVLAALAGVPLAARAQFRVDVSGVGMQQLPIALAEFRDQPKAPQPISAIVQADLERSGRFRAADASAVSLDENSAPDMALWRQRGADALVCGSISTPQAGRHDVRFRLWDTVKSQDLGGQAFSVVTADLRLVAHRIADYVYEKLLGERGVFSTRLAYVTQQAGRHTLWVADADGENAQPALSSTEPIISPAWSPDGRQLAYVSFESRKPVVYVHEIATGRRRLVANFRGSNSAPAWSPDGQRLAVTLTRDGSSQLYLISAQGGEAQRLMQSSGIDTEPVFAPDGHSIYFVSDRGGSPQIYRVAIQGDGTGSAVQRVTFSGNYNISPTLSADGQWMAYISRIDGAMRLHAMHLPSGRVTALTGGSYDESPSFAPNSRLIVYATRHEGRDALMTTTPDGRIRAHLGGQGGDLREPAWGPFHQP